MMQEAGKMQLEVGRSLGIGQSSVKIGIYEPSRMISNIMSKFMTCIIKNSLRPWPISRIYLEFR